MKSASICFTTLVSVVRLSKLKDRFKICSNAILYYLEACFESDADMNLSRLFHEEIAYFEIKIFPEFEINTHYKNLMVHSFPQQPRNRKEYFWNVSKNLRQRWDRFGPLEDLRPI